MNREAWLAALAEKLRPLFDNASLELPEKIHISAGFPSKGGLANKKRRIGEHWIGSASADGVPHIFISPILQNEIEVGATLVHELLHAALPGAKHGPRFRAAMPKVGLEGKPTATVAGDALKTQLAILVEGLGPYPHGGLAAFEPEKKQSTRMKKLTCEVHPEYIVRASQKVIDLGLPVCGLCDAEYRANPDAELPPSMQVAGGKS